MALFAPMLTAALALDGVISRIDGVILLCVFMVWLTSVTLEVRRQRSAAEKKADREFVTASMALALTTGGVFWPPLNLLGVPALLVTIRPLLAGAYRSIRYDKKIGVGVLDSLGTVCPLLMQYFFIAALASWMSSLSRKLLLKTEDRSRASLANVLGEQPAVVWVLHDGVEMEWPFEQVRAGDIIVVDAGQSIPVDGVIGEGVASVDESSLTGESQPVEKAAGVSGYGSKSQARTRWRPRSARS